MSRRMLALLHVLIASTLVAETLRGPAGGVLLVGPDLPPTQATVNLEGVLLIDLAGETRFLDAVELELTAPRAVTDAPGAVVLRLLGPVQLSERAGVVEAVGEELLLYPLQRAGKLYFQIPLRQDAAVDASAVTKVLPRPVDPADFPLALSVLSLMKGPRPDLQKADFVLTAGPATRNIGAVRMRFIGEDGRPAAADPGRTPDYWLSIDGKPVPVEPEYLLEPGLRRVRLYSDVYRGFETTIGVDRGATVILDIPLSRALATVTYSAPRGAIVYLNGAALDGPQGDFTVPPGEHTLVVVIGDYTVSRRFSVSDQKRYSVAVRMEIAVEEIK